MKQLDDVRITFYHLSTKLHNTAETLKQLGELQTALPEVNPIQCEGQIDIYKDLSETMVKWSAFQMSNSNIVRDELEAFFHRKKAEVKAMKQLLREREITLTDYSKQYRKLQTRKTKLWTSKDSAKWGLSDESLNVDELLSNKEYAMGKMLPKESEQVEALRKYYNFFNYQMGSELQRVFGDVSEQENEHFTSLSKEMIEKGEEIMGNWKEMQEKCMKRRETSMQSEA